MEERKSTREGAIAMVCGSGRMAVLLMGLVFPSIPDVGVGSESPESTAELAHSAPSVVVLPPQVNAAAAPQVRAAAELACDRLAQEITAAGLARVVDRQQIGRLLQERAVASEPVRSMLSFDAMLRLEVDASALVPMATVRLVDLSHGNLLSEAEYDWPLREEDLPAMVEQCREAFKQVGQPKDGKLRVRCFGAANPERNPRIAPLAARLGQVFEQAVARSPGLVAVRHLEAASAKEESLMLLMGLSRLPGGRQFVPQADATIELGLREGDGRGKTFEETPVEITVHVTRADAEEGQSLVVGGTVGEFDAAAARAWEQLAETLREAQPAAAADWLSEMAVRRRQAEAELRAGAALDPNLPQERRALARLAHVESALKIDPTCEPAAHQRILVLYELVASRLSDPNDAETRHRLILEAARYMERFDGNFEHRSEILSRVWLGVRFTPLFRFFDGGTAPLTPELRQLLDAMQRLIEQSLSGDIRGFDRGGTSRMLLVFYRGTAAAGVPLERRRQWLDEMLRRADEQAKQSEKIDAQFRTLVLEGHLCFRVCAAELAIDDAEIARARQLMAQVQSRFGQVGDHNHDLVQLMRRVIERIDDAPGLAEFDRWVKHVQSQRVRTLLIRWPAIEVFRDEVRTEKWITRTMPRVEGIGIHHAPLAPGDYRAPISALVEGDGRLYVVMGGNNPISWDHFRGSASGGPSQWIGSLSLDDAGRPVGDLHHEKRTGSELLDAVTLLPQPGVDPPLHVLAATYLARRLYLGTLRNGLLVFDPTTERWSRFGPEQGLPAEGVYAVHPLDGQTLFCAGRSEQRALACYTLRLPEGTVTLRHRMEGELSRSLPAMFWHDGQSLRAWSRHRLCDDLLAPELKVTRQDCGVPYGWAYPDASLGCNYPEGFIACAEVDGRRFVTNAGLQEFDARGKIVRSWWGKSNYDTHYGPEFSLSLPPDCPIQSMYMVAAGERLVFIGSESVLAWDPKTDTWYGPLAVTEACHAVGTRRGIWLGTGEGLVFVAMDNLLATAERLGRVMTTDQYRRRQQEVIAAMPPVDRAKVAYSMRQLDQAKKLTQTALEDDPECAEALLLMGYLHDVWALNQPEVAMEYYGRLAELTANPNASFTGMYRRLVFLRAQKRWPEAMTVIEKIDATFPRLYDFHQRGIDWWRNHIQEQLAETDAKQPADETSNKEERPGN